MTLTVKDAAFSYGEKTVFEKVNFEVKGGEILAVLGPNGSGKTTLLRCVMGMLKLKSGYAGIDGKDVKEMSAAEFWRKTAYVPQSRGDRAPAYPVFETVLLGRSSSIGMFGKPTEKDELIAREAIKKLGIEALADRKCSELSGGERQMVYIARAIAAEPGILILDEPESNLDFRNQMIVLETMKKLAEDGMACVFNTHYPEHAMRIADKALLLNNGTAETGTTGEIMTEAKIGEAFGVDVRIGTVDDIPTVVARNLRG